MRILVVLFLSCLSTTALAGPRSDMIGDPVPSRPVSPVVSAPPVVAVDAIFPALHLPPVVDVAALADAVGESVGRRLDVDRAELIGAIRDLSKQMAPPPPPSVPPPVTRVSVQSGPGCTDCPGPESCRCACNTAARTGGVIMPRLHFVKDDTGHWWYGTDPAQVRGHVAQVNLALRSRPATVAAPAVTYTSAPAYQYVPSYPSVPLLPASGYSAPLYPAGGYFGGAFAGGGGCAGGSCR